MHLFYVGFFALVALLLFIDLGVLHRKAQVQSFRTAAGWTAAWMTLGFSFSGIVYGMYEYHWLGATMVDPYTKAAMDGTDATMVYISAYLLEYALSVDNIFVISLLFVQFKIPPKYQHRVLFWGIMGAVVFRVAMIGGGAYLAKQFSWIFYIFGGYLVYAGAKLFKHEDGNDDPLENNRAVRFLRRFVRIVDGDHGGKFSIVERGRRALTMLAVCLIVVELTDIVFALDSIPAVLSISQETFIMVTSNIFAILGLRSLYFVLAGMMAKFDYLKYSLAVLLILIGAKMIAHDHYHVSHQISLAAIAGIIGLGVIASIISTKRSERAAAALPTAVVRTDHAEPAAHDSLTDSAITTTLTKPRTKS
jgi:tellurite resistance protein TerC